MTRHLPRPIDLPTQVPLAPDADLGALDEAKVFAAPDDPADWPAWRAQLGRWREEAQQRIGYRGPRYAGRPTPPYALAFANLWDETLFDHAAGRFEVDAFLDASARAFGGLDGVLLWHAYPVLGIDERDQAAFYRELPDLPEAVARFQARGVKVFVSHYPWADEPGAQADEEVVKLLRWLNADGLFLDSSREARPTLIDALARNGLDVSVGGESKVPLAGIADHEISWAQFFADSAVPGVLRSPWFERGHMLHHTRRWHHSHLEELHSAWLNGCGVLLWENVFGAWVGWNARDRVLLRRMRAVQRSCGAHLRHGDWTPLADHPGEGAKVYASRWALGDEVLWTVVNRGEAYDGPWLRAGVAEGLQWVDLVSGRPLQPRVDGGQVIVGGPLPAGAIAAVFAGRRPPSVEPPGAGDVAAIRGQDDTFPLRVATRLSPAAAAAPSAVAGSTMARVQGGRRELQVSYRLRECGLYGETPFVDEWKPPLGTRLHREAVAYRRVDIAPFLIDPLEVSNAEYARFLAESGYAPRRTTRFLAHWQGGSPTPEQADAPVVNVDLDDARAYAAWRGLRLPSEDEWQWAGEEGLLLRREPLVWNLTESEHSDGRTRFLLLKGGSGFSDTRSVWYFDGGPRPAAWSAKMIVLAGGLSRSPWVGFRCAADA